MDIQLFQSTLVRNHMLVTTEVIIEPVLAGFSGAVAPDLVLQPRYRLPPMRHFGV